MGGCLRNRLAERPARRAITPIVGLVLLFGLVAAVSVGIFVVASDSLDATEANADRERAEQSLTELSSQLESGSDGSSGGATVNLQEGQRLDVTENATQISLWVNTSDNGVDGATYAWNVSTVAYEVDDTTITYENGAVWRGDGTATQLVSAPSFGFSEDAFSLPVTNLRAEGPLSDTVSMVQTDSTTNASLSQLPVDGEIVVEIDSAYHAGWADYLESVVGDRGAVTHHANGTVSVAMGDEPEGYRTITKDETKTVVDKPDDYFDDVATIDGDLTTGDLFNSMETTGDVTASGEITNYDLESFLSLFPWVDSEREALLHENQDLDRETHDDVIQELVDEGDAWEPLITERRCERDEKFFGIVESHDCTLNDETYYVDDWNQDRQDELTVDVAENDVTIVVDDDFEVRGSYTEWFPGLGNTTDLRVKNADSGHHVSIFVTGDIRFDQGTACVENCDYVTGTYVGNLFESDAPDEMGAEALQIYGTGDSDVEFRGDNVVEGVISAPPGDDGDQESRFGDDGTDFSFGQTALMGAIDVGESTFLGDLDLIYDEDLRDFEWPEAFEEQRTVEREVGKELRGNVTYVTVTERQAELTDR